MDPRSFRFVIATNQQVVAWVQGYSPRMGRKLYFLLDYESYLLPDRRLVLRIRANRQPSPWITHRLAPDDQRLRELYNHSRRFLGPSEWEGFGQPGAEAMACGAALISTRNGGVEMYAEDRRSAILCLHATRRRWRRRSSSWHKTIA